jgi:toxin ParE1/3/4
MMHLELSSYVEEDLDAIADFIAQDNPQRALTFIKEIRQKFSNIQRTPLIYQLRPDIGKEARLATVGNYVILFHITKKIVRIERVIYGGRNLPEIFDPS